jgi:hypothetical protein
MVAFTHKREPGEPGFHGIWGILAKLVNVTSNNGWVEKLDISILMTSILQSVNGSYKPTNIRNVGRYIIM